MSTHLFVQLESFWRLSLAAPHVETDPLCLGASALARSFSAFCLRIGSLQSPACCPDAAVWRGIGAKTSCLITVKCPVCVTQHWYSTHDKWPHPLRFEGVSGKEKARLLLFSPLVLGSRHRCQDLSAVPEICLGLVGMKCVQTLTLTFHCWSTSSS